MKIEDKYKWLARDKNGELWAFVNKPEKVKSVKVWEDPIDLNCEEIPENKDGKYSFIKWEDEEPFEIGKDSKGTLYGLDGSVEEMTVRIVDGKNSTQEDIINKPSHYHKNNIDVIGFSEAQFSKEELKGFYRINAIKYLTRYDRKENAVSDLNKANFYTNKLLELETHAAEE